jgi:pimeloyl-ACP methyl ester carboxylesterase
VREVRTPTMLIIGDADIVRPEHTVAMFRLLGGGVAGDLIDAPRSQLAILPGTSHVGLLERVEWLQSMIISFLDDPNSSGR